MLLIQSLIFATLHKVSKTIPYLVPIMSTKQRLGFVYSSKVDNLIHFIARSDYKSIVVVV